MIKGYCLIKDGVAIAEDHKDVGQWPQVFGAIPHKGDFIQSVDGVCLTVLCVVHYQNGTKNQASPAIRVILGEPIWNLTHTDY